DMKVLVVEGERGMGDQGGSALPLAMALAPPVEGAQGDHPKTDSYVWVEVISDIVLSNRVMSNYRAICLADVAQIPPGLAKQLALFVKQGGSLMIFMGPHVQA